LPRNIWGSSWYVLATRHNCIPSISLEFDVTGCAVSCTTYMGPVYSSHAFGRGAMEAWGCVWGTCLTSRFGSAQVTCSTDNVVRIYEALDVTNLSQWPLMVRPWLHQILPDTEKAFHQDQERPNRLEATEVTDFWCVRFRYIPHHQQSRRSSRRTIAGACRGTRRGPAPRCSASAPRTRRSRCARGATKCPLKNHIYSQT
jgi:hypothetical protein